MNAQSPRNTLATPLAEMSAEGGHSLRGAGSLAASDAALIANGYEPVAVAGKRALGQGWTTRPNTIDAITAERDTLPNAINTGARTGRLSVADIDLIPPDHAARMKALAFDVLGGTLLERVGSKGMALGYRNETPIGKITISGLHSTLTQTANGKTVLLPGKVEILGMGQQLAIYGEHPDTGKPFAWPNAALWGEPLQMPLCDAPEVTPESLRDFARQATLLMKELGYRDVTVTEPGAAPTQAMPSAAAGKPVAREHLRTILSFVDPDCERSEWRNIVAGIRATPIADEAGEGERREIAHQWSRGELDRHGRYESATPSRYTGDEAVDTVFDTMPPKAGGVGYGTIYHAAKAGGYDGPPATHTAAEAFRGYAERTGVKAGAAVPAATDRKQPLFRPLPPPPDFPADALGPLHAAAAAIHETVRAPFAICAQSVLAAATLAIQAHADVELPGAGRRPLTGLFVSVAESGERKTSVDRLALRAVHEAERQFRERHSGAAQAHANAKAAWEAAREHAKKAAKGDAGAFRAALDKIGSEPKAPPPPMLLVSDPTPEALVLHLAEGRPWGGVFTSEGGILIGGAAFNDETKMRTGALLNTLWDGEPIRRRRVLTGACYLPGRRCSAHVMMQPNVGTRLFSDATLDGIGTLARTLVVAPESNAGTRMFRDQPEVARAALEDYYRRLLRLLTRQPRTEAGNPDVLDPLALTLSPDARNMWIAFHDETEAALRPDGDLASIRPFAAKMPEHAGRLAAVLAFYADPETMDVPSAAMAWGIALARHYARELTRLHDAAVVAPDLRLAARLLIWWQARLDPRCHLAGIYQKGLNAISNAATARRIVGILQDHGWVRRLPEGTELDGAPRREAWELEP